MPGDFSRSTFDATKHYSSVRWQQGRVQLDADFNELADILQHRVATQVADLVGPSGAPVRNAGFQIQVADGKLIAAPGRFYVDGLLCENDFNFPVAPVDDAGQPLSPGGYFVYLDVWERDVTHLEDASLTDAALGGVDTTVRRKTAFQVRLMGLASATPGEKADPRLLRKVRQLQAESNRLSDQNRELQKTLDEALADLNANPEIVARREKLAALDRKIANSPKDAVDAKLIAIRTQLQAEIDQASQTIETDKFPKLGDIRKNIASNEETLRQLGAQINQINAEIGGSSSSLTDLVRDAIDGLRQSVLASRCARLSPELAEHCAEFGNQLYRVETHVAAKDGLRFLKWSRDNASDGCRGRLSGTRITVERWTNGAQSRFRAGDWVEVNDWTRVAAGRTGFLVKLADAADESLTLAATGADIQTAIDIAEDADVLVARWDGVEALPSQPMLDDKGEERVRVSIERGLSGRLTIPAGGSLRSGDYWLLPTRHQGEPLLWPRKTDDPQAGYVERPADGVRHSFAPLAALTVGKDGAIEGEPVDLRLLFVPIVEGAVRKTGDEMQGDLKINANLIVRSQTTLAGALSVGQEASFAGDLEVAGRMTGRGPVFLEGRTQLRSVFVAGGDSPTNALFVHCEPKSNWGGLLLHERSLLAWRQMAQGTQEGRESARLSFQLVESKRPENVLANDVLVVSARGNGRVGVGVAPETMLHVKEDGRFEGGLRVDKQLAIGTDHTGAVVNIKSASTSPFELNKGQRALVISNAAGAPDNVPCLGLGVFSTGEPFVRNYSWLDANGAPLAINPTGRNVAVGHADPQANLHVKGTFRVTDKNGKDAVKVEGTDVRFDGDVYLNPRNDKPVGSRESMRILAATIYWTYSNSQRWVIKDQTGGLELDIFQPTGTFKFSPQFTAVPIVIVTPPQYVPTAPFGAERKGSEFLQIQNISATGFRIVTEGNWNPSEGNVYAILVIGRN